MKRTLKEEIRKMSHKEMINKLQELNLEKMKAESYMRLGGHLKLRVAMDKAQNYIGNKDKKLPNTLKNIKKMIAFIKQEMHLKYFKGDMNGKVRNNIQ